MESVIQRGRAEGEGEAVPVIIMTHDTKEAQIQRALARIAELAVVVEQPRLIRIVDLSPPAIRGSDAASQVVLPLALQFYGPQPAPGARHRDRGRRAGRVGPDGPRRRERRRE